MLVDTRTVVALICGGFDVQPSLVDLAFLVLLCWSKGHSACVHVVFPFESSTVLSPSGVNRRGEIHHPVGMPARQPLGISCRKMAPFCALLSCRVWHVSFRHKNRLGRYIKPMTWGSELALHRLFTVSRRSDDWPVGDGGGGCIRIRRAV